MMAKILSALFISLMLMIDTVYAGLYQGQYPHEGKNITNNVINILVEEGYCFDENDCRYQEYVFVEGTRKGLSFSIHGIRDPRTINRIIQIIITEHQRSAKNADFYISFYGLGAKNKGWIGILPQLIGDRESFIYIELKGAK